jgi:tape measure domain-containing protein
MAGKGKPIGTIFVELDLDGSSYTKKQKEILQGAKVTVLDVEKNWRTIGSSSDKMYDAMRQNILNAYNQIANSAKSSAQDIIRAEEAKNAKIKQINEQQYGHHVSFTERLKKNWQEVAAAAYLAYQAFQTGKEMITASLAMERISMSMNAVADNTTLAAREIQYIREESERLGLVFNDATVEYVKFAAAAKNTSIEGEATRKIFTGMSEAITALKLSTMDANLIYMAMTQMISKGKVSMEELRRQMGERLPGAIRLAAEGMGMSTMELIKNIEAGKVMAYDLLPKLAEKLHETYGQAALEAAQMGQAVINRFTNAVFDTKAALGGSLMPVLTDVLSLIKQTLPYITAFVGGIKILAVEAAAWADSMVLDDPNKVGMSYKEQLDMIEKVKEESKLAIVNQMTPGISSAKTPAELALEQTKIENAKKREIVDPTSKEKVRAAKDEADKILKIQQDANMAIAKHREDATKEYEKLLTNETDFALTENERQIAQIERQEQDKLWTLNVMLQEETISWEQYEKAKTAVQTNAAKARLTNETENAKRIAGINYNLIQDIIGMEETAFNLRMEMIEAEKKKYIADGGDIVHAAKWAADQQTKALIKLGKTGDNISGGMSAAFQQLYLDQLTYGQAGYDMTMGFYSSTSGMFGSMLYDMKGGMSAFSDYWDAFTDSLWKVFSNMVSKMLSDWLYAMAAMADSSSGLFGGGGGFSWTSLIPGYGMFSSLSSLFSGGAAVGGAAMGAEMFSAEAIASMVWLHKGGVVGQDGDRGYAPASVFTGAPRYHLGVDEVPAILQKGERVIPKGKGISGNTYVTIPITIEGSVISEHELARRLVPKINKAVKEGVH